MQPQQITIVWPEINYYNSNAVSCIRRNKNLSIGTNKKWSDHTYDKSRI